MVVGLKVVLCSCVLKSLFVLCSRCLVGVSNFRVVVVGVILVLLCISSGLFVRVCRCCSCVFKVGCVLLSCIVVLDILCLEIKVCSICIRRRLILLNGRFCDIRIYICRLYVVLYNYCVVVGVLF